MKLSKLYAVFVIWTETENHTQKHYRFKAEICFPPQLYFFTQLQKVVFFNVSRTFNSDAKLGPRLGAL